MSNDIESRNNQSFECPDCGSIELDDLNSCCKPIERDRLSNLENSLVEKLRETKLVKCKICSLVSRQPTMTELELEGLYSSLPANRWTYDAKQLSSWDIASKWLAKNYSHANSMKILDVGSFDGSFLEQQNDRWQKFAIEPNTNVIDEIERKGISHVGRFLKDTVAQENSENRIQPASLDVVTLFDVFEHLAEPTQELDRIHTLLTKGGHLVISTGDSNSWSMRLLKGHHCYFNSVQHICVGNIKYFKKVASKLGFKVVCSKTHSHQKGNVSKKIQQLISIIHFWSLRQSGFKRRIARVLQFICGDPSLIHQTGPPHSPNINDHIFVVLKKLK